MSQATARPLPPPEESQAPAHAPHRAVPVGGRLLTPAFLISFGLAVAFAALVLWRVFYGLGSVGAMTDGFSWGIWKPLNVVTFTGIGAGAYGTGLLVYVLNRGRYHALVRPAVLVGAIAYTLGGLSVLVDLGRWWNAWMLPLYWHWNLNSILLEVALCVLSYVGVLWVELMPAALERWKDGEVPGLARLGARGLGFFQKALPWIVALALLLPTMHQSSLGSMYLLAVGKLHPLWHTPLLPLLFLVSCLVMGYGAVVALALLLNVFFGEKRDLDMLSGIARIAAWMTLGYVIVRVADLALRGRTGLMFAFDRNALLFWAETALFVAGAAFMLSGRLRRNPGWLFGSGLLLVAAGALYRFSTYLLAYDPGPGWHYFPSVGEILVSVGLAGVGMVIFLFVIKVFPILSGIPASGRLADRNRGQA